MGLGSSRARKTVQSRPASAPLYPAEPPPPYTPTAQPNHAHSMAYGVNQYQASANGYPTQNAYPTANYPSQNGYTVTPVYHASFDAGARFDGISQPSIPPPPPGVYPNAAQMAVANGQKVILNKKKNTFLSGGSGSGYTFW